MVGQFTYYFNDTGGNERKNCFAKKMHKRKCYSNPIVINVFFFFSVTFHIQNEYGEKFAEQKACHQNVVCRCVGVFHLLDTVVRHQHIDAVPSQYGLPEVGLSNDWLFPVARLLVVVLQSHHVLLHESWISQSVLEFISLLQAIRRKETH